MNQWRSKPHGATWPRGLLSANAAWSVRSVLGRWRLCSAAGLLGNNPRWRRLWQTDGRRLRPPVGQTMFVHLGDMALEEELTRADTGTLSEHAVGATIVHGWNYTIRTNLPWVEEADAGSKSKQRQHQQQICHTTFGATHSFRSNAVHSRYIAQPEGERPCPHEAPGSTSAPKPRIEWPRQPKKYHTKHYHTHTHRHTHAHARTDKQINNLSKTINYFSTNYF